jgi:hypothetical protein
MLTSVLPCRLCSFERKAKGRPDYTRATGVILIYVRTTRLSLYPYSCGRRVRAHAWFLSREGGF